ncbi:telomere-binding protein cav-like [Calliphora vicina]|uniref:telomere-binding protein cav-like n=1 Tax=Calliphora vicina TaxID=7373 RepID=UPI00325B5893
MDEEINGNSEVYNHYLELSKPTKADLEKVFTDDELKKLCLKLKCRVDIWRWNVVNDYRIAFTKSGRYQKWSEPVRLGTLAKAVNKMKPSVLYDEQEIIETRKEEWEFQLKDNILSLNYWERGHKSPKQVVTGSEDVDEDVEYDINTESMNETLLTQSEVNLESKIDEELLIDDDDDSEDSVKTVLYNENEVQSEEVVPEINNMYGVNTMSMTIDSQMNTQSQDLHLLQSQDVIPATYDNFKHIIPLTSTQSQSPESE